MSEEDQEKLREANKLAGKALASNNLAQVIEIMGKINALLDTITK